MNFKFNVQVWLLTLEGAVTKPPTPKPSIQFDKATAEKEVTDKYGLS